MTRGKDKSRRRRAPSKPEWDAKKDEIIRTYLRFDLPETKRRMEGQQFFAEDHHYQYRFRIWKVPKYGNRQRHDEMLREILETHRAGQSLPQVTAKVLNQLRRRFRERGNPDETLKELLNQMRDSPCLPTQSSSSSDGDVWQSNQIDSENSSELSSMDSDDDEDDNEDDSEDDDDAPEESDGEASFQIVHRAESSEDFTHSASEDLAVMISSLNLSPIDHITGLEEILHLTRNHYQGSIYHYTNAAEMSMMPMIPGSEVQANLVRQEQIKAFALNRAFWTKVKSAIYYFKMGGSHDKLAFTLLHESSPMMLELCRHQPFTIWKDIFATLNPVNVAIKKDVLSKVIQGFASIARQQYAQIQHHPFLMPLLCLEDEDLFSASAVTVLQMLHHESAVHLPPGHDEIFEVERTLIRLLRRQRRLADAKRLCNQLITETGLQYGPCDEKTRLAMTELVYVLNDEGNWQKSKDLAEKIIARGKQNSAREPLPHKRQISAMEDAAFIYEKLDRMEDAITWLRRAQTDALELGQENGGILHINRKLEAAFAKVGQRV